MVGNFANRKHDNKKPIIMNLIRQTLMAGSCIALTTAAQAATQTKPNIVIFYMDDMGYGDLSLTGATGYSTPNIDGIAHDGMFFTHYYASSAISTASRAGLLTGCYATRVGVPGCYMTDQHVGLNPEEQILPEVLRTAGYHSGIVGKWHLGCGEHFMPMEQGFDEFFGMPYSNDIWPVDYEGNRISEKSVLPERAKKYKAKFPALTLYEGREKVRELWTLDDQSELTTLYTERSVRFIEENRKQPFFLLVTHDMPHVPLAVSSKFKGKSKAGLFGDVMMEVDWSVGQILAALKKNGLEKNTIVIFTSDNGPWLTYGNHSGSAGSLREGKQCSFDGGQRVPCLVKWPGHVPAGVVNPQLTSNIDILPTLVAITGATLPEKKIDGVDVTSLWKGETTTSPRKYFYYYYSQNPAGVLKSLEAVRDDRYKLVFPHKYLTNEGQGVTLGKDGFPGVTQTAETGLALYDLRLDPGERLNVKDQYPEVVKRLQQAAEEMRNDLGDDLNGIESANIRPDGKF